MRESALNLASGEANTSKKRQHFIEEIKAKQRNTVWPDTLVNSRAVDYLIFKGSKGATRLQRIGIALFGVFFMLAGVAFIGIGRESHSVLWIVISLAWFLLGMRVLINAFRGAWSK
jgi:hypothetical protein